jgi:membrane protease YdiL (CAAX protease family)
VGVPIAARGLSLAAALAVVALVLVPSVGAFGEDNIVAASGLLAGVPMLAFLAWIALAPDHADDTLDRVGLDLSQPRHLVGLGVHLAFVWVVFGWSAILQTARRLSQFLATGEHPAVADQIGSTELVVSLLGSLVLFVVAALTWLWLVEELDLGEIVDELRVQIDELPSGIVYGALMTIGVLVAIAGLGFVFQQLGIEPKNPQAEAMADALSWQSALLVAALAGLGEEIYFRGFLLDRVGNLGQAVLFGIVHASYLTAFQVLLPFALGLAFGWLVRRSNLWAAIVSHASFNAVMLLGQIYQDELADMATHVLG